MADAHMLKNLSLSPELFFGSKLLAFQQKIIQCINFFEIRSSYITIGNVSIYRYPKKYLALLCKNISRLVLRALAAMIGGGYS